jgi:PAS domain S-box-containing protein
MYELDFITARFASSAIVVGMLISLWMFYGKREFRPGANYWVQGIVLYAVGYFLFIIRSQYLLALTNTLMAVSLLASSVWFHHGISTTLGYPPRSRVGLALLVATAIYMSVAHGFQLDSRYTIGFITFWIAVWSFLAAGLLLKHQWNKGKLVWRTPEFGSAVVFFWYGCYQSTQFCYLLIVTNISLALVDLSFLGNSLFVGGLTLTFILTAYHQLEIQVKDLLDATNKLQTKREQNMQARWLLALENAKAGVWELDLTTNIMKASRQVAAMLGMDQDDYEITHAVFLNRLHPEDRDHYLLDLQEIRDGISDTLNREHRLHKSDGNYLWVACLGKVIKDDLYPDHLIISGTNTDITDSKENQSKLESAIVEAQGARIAAITARQKALFLPIFLTKSAHL